MALLSLGEVGRLPGPSDNCAIAIRRIEAGERLALDGVETAVPVTVLEGHRFAVRPIAPGEPLLSWGRPFGRASSPVAPGEWVRNPSMIEALAARQTGAQLPGRANFSDLDDAFQPADSSFKASAPVEPAAGEATFSGYRRPGRRGVGTRNTVVILGTTARTAAYARGLAARLRPLVRAHPGIDGIVAVAHTEGDGPALPNNARELFRTLAGFMVHPNVAAVLAADDGGGAVTNAALESFMREEGHPLDEVPHRFIRLRGESERDLAEGEAVVRAWLPAAAAALRTAEPVAGLRVALQCGGSDAFSGVSGNPLAGAVVHELVRHGGSGNLCETDELMGAEAYVLDRVAGPAVARAILAHIDSFRRRLAWHGVTPESNPSAGNKLRGLYNIALKSLGATRKKDPRTRIDAVIDYAEPMTAPGFYFMNSPGNDLEGIAGQVAAGCNLIVFVTGNGSVTNFPFVPTLKVTTTTRRHRLLEREMDVNAGRYLDGTPMEELALETFGLLLETASGRRTRGEEAGHAQVSIWRNWRQTDSSQLARLQAKAAPRGEPVRPAFGWGEPAAFAKAGLPLFRLPEGAYGADRVGLVLPASLCAAEIARLAAARLGASGAADRCGISRFVSLPHTEGCGFGGDSMHRLLRRLYRGYATHPNVAGAVLLEHGCEKIPNDAIRADFARAGLDANRFGWASVQLDGGIERAVGRIEAWFAGRAGLAPALREAAPAASLSVALIAEGIPDRPSARAFAEAARTLLAAGCTVLVADEDPLLSEEAGWCAALALERPLQPTLAAGERPRAPGLHVVDVETVQWTEVLTGLGACGPHLILALAGERERPGHPFIPVIRAAPGADPDADLRLRGRPEEDAAALLDLAVRVVSGSSVPRALAGGRTDFQITRGLLGVST